MRCFEIKCNDQRAEGFIRYQIPNQPGTVLCDYSNFSAEHQKFLRSPNFSISTHLLTYDDTHGFNIVTRSAARGAVSKYRAQVAAKPTAVAAQQSTATVKGPSKPKKTARGTKLAQSRRAKEQWEKRRAIANGKATDAVAGVSDSSSGSDIPAANPDFLRERRRNRVSGPYRPVPED